MQNAVVLVVGQLRRGVDTTTQGTTSWLPSARVSVTGTVAPVVGFADRQYQSSLPRLALTFTRYALRKFQRQDAHAN